MKHKYKCFCCSVIAGEWWKNSVGEGGWRQVKKI